MNDLRATVKKLGFDLPEPAAAAANYDPCVVVGNQVWVSGQLPMQGGEILYRGKVGHDLSIEDGYEAAKLCGLNILAQLNKAVDGDTSRVVRCIKIGGFVNAVPTFESHPKVLNGASDLMISVFGDRGRHARFAMGAGSLPFNVAVEVDAVFQIMCS